MKKIANLTLVIRNFGNKLQSYALCKVIKSFNLAEPEVIRLSDGWGYGNVSSLRKKQLLDLIKTYKLKSFRRMYDFVRYNLQYRQIRKNSDFEVKNHYILIEKAIKDKCNVIIAPDGIIGNIIFRTLVLVNSWPSCGAVTFGINSIYIDTSRDQNINGYLRSLKLAYKLANI